MADGEAFVTLRHVTKRYRNVTALDDISLDIRRHEIFGYIGPNGAGKTTTLKLLVGLLTDFRGEVVIDGHAMPQKKAAVHRLLGYLPQQVAFQEWRTVDHALSTFGKLSGVPKGELDRRIEDVLGTLRLTPARYRRLSELSGGTIQRVGLAQAMLHRPALLVLDEPLAGLDPASRHHVKEVIRQLGRQNTTILFSSHILSDVQDVADRIAILNQGRLVHVGTMAELTHALQLNDEIEVSLSHDSGTWPELRSLEGVLSIEERSPGLLLVQLVETADRDETIHRLITGLLSGGSRIRTIQPVVRSLDEVYLRSLEGGEEE